MDRHFSPVSDHLFIVLRDPLRETIPLDGRYEETFDRFEHLLVLVIQDQMNQGARVRFAAPVGRLQWKTYTDEEKDPAVAIPAEAAASGSAWPPLVAGLFAGDEGRFNRAVEGYQEILNWARREGRWGGVR